MPLALVLALLVGFPASLAAQTFVGRIVDAESGEGISGAFVELLAGDEERLAGVFTDRGGRFEVRADPGAGDLLLSAGALGYGRVAWTLDGAPPDAVAELGTLALTAVPIELSPFEVQPTRSRLTPGREWVRRRQLLGRGQFFPGAMPAAINPPSLSEYLARETALWVRYDERGTPTVRSPVNCMLLWVNEWPMNELARNVVATGPQVGVPMGPASFGTARDAQMLGFPSFDDIPIEAIAAIEVYAEMRDVPPGRLAFTMSGAAHACGVVNVWTWDSW